MVTERMAAGVIEQSSLEHISLEQIRRYALFTHGQRVGLAVSGGADSICLLHLMHDLAPRWNLHLTVLHIEHGIRGAASRADAAFVQQAAADFGLPYREHRADAPAVNDNLEQAARQIRAAFFAELISSGQVDRVATGHTASDQAETVLYRFLRGSGLGGLSGIRPITCDGLVRPLLSVWRPEIEKWLRERNIAWREDASNQDLAFARNRLRHETLPLLREAFNPNLDQTLAQMAILAQDEESYWQKNADKVRVCVGPAGGPVILLAERLADSPPGLARRQLRHAAERVKGNLREIEFQHIETVLEMARAGPGHNRTQLPGLDVLRSFEWIRIARLGFDSGVERDFEIAVTVPGSVRLPAGGTVLFNLCGSEVGLEPYDRVGKELDWQSLRSIYGPGASDRNDGCDLFELRNWRPGDHYQAAGQSRDKKLKTLFQEERIPLWERRHWPVFTCRGDIVWSRRFGPAATVVGRTGCFPVLRITEVQ